MKISRVQSFLMSCPLPEPLPLPFYGGTRTVLKRDAMLIRIETFEGLVGWAPGPADERAHRAIRDTVGPFLEGRTLADTDALRVHFTNDPAGADAEILKVYSAVEVALFDLLGKAMGVPVSEIAGGRVRDRIRLYGSAGLYLTPEEHAKEAAAVAALGFRAYKMRAGMGPERDLEAVRLVREACPDIDIMVDAHAWWHMRERGYGRETVEQLARGMAESAIGWLEEPIEPDDHDGYLQLKDLDIAPLASGTHEPDEARYLDLIFTQAVDYVQMDVLRQGGFTLARRLFGEIEKEGMCFAFANSGTALDAIAAAHLGICWPEGVVEWLEYPVHEPGVLYPFPLAGEILTNPLEIEKGELMVPREPGLGVEIDERVIEKYPWIAGPERI